MKSLLDRFLPDTTAFRPSTATEMFAVKLALRLEDAVAVRHYVTLAQSYTECQLRYNL